MEQVVLFSMQILSTSMILCFNLRKNHIMVAGENNLLEENEREGSDWLTGGNYHWNQN